MDPATQTFLTTLLYLLPEPFRSYGATAIGVAGILSLVASFLAAVIKPPSAASAEWKRRIYQVATWPALNFGWARNAVLPGMPRVVQQAALVTAKLAAAAPALTTVAEAPAIAGIIAPGTTAPGVATPFA